MDITIHLRGEWWEDAPKTKIRFDGLDVWQGTVESDIRQEFEVPTAGKIESILSIELYDKKVNQTVCEGNTIVRDQLLTIEQIIIDDIDLGLVLFNNSQYYPQYPEHMIEESARRNQTLPFCLNKITTLGWNGVWQLKFTYPFEIWYLENLP
jgi:hypothetical protein